MKFLKDRNLIIIAIVLILLIGGYYVTNTGKKSSSSTSSQNNQVKLNDSGSSTKSTNTSNEPAPPPTSITSKNIVSTSPSANASVTTKPTKVTLTVDKSLAAGSEIKVVSDKKVDVVTGGNKLSTDLKTLSAPVSITAPGTYTVSYSLNWVVGGTTTGTYNFTVK